MGYNSSATTTQPYQHPTRNLVMDRYISDAARDGPYHGMAAYGGFQHRQTVYQNPGSSSERSPLSGRSGNRSERGQRRRRHAAGTEIGGAGSDWGLDDGEGDERGVGNRS
jgi:hypothetical protein